MVFIFLLVFNCGGSSVESEAENSLLDENNIQQEVVESGGDIGAAEQVMNEDLPEVPVVSEDTSESPKSPELTTKDISGEETKVES